MRELFILHSVFPYIRRKVKEKGEKELGGGGGEREKNNLILFSLNKGKILAGKRTSIFLLN